MGILIRERTWVDKTWYFYIILLAAATYVLIKMVMESKLGYYFVAIREDQDAAESLGIDTTFYKTISLFKRGLKLGIAGAYYMNYMGYIDPSTVFPLAEVSIAVVVVVMDGGCHILGPIVGAVVVSFSCRRNTLYPFIGAAHQTIFGIILILIVMFLPMVLLVISED